MLNISYEQRKAWQNKNASQILISMKGSKSKFTSPDYKNFLNQSASTNNSQYFKLTDIVKNYQTPFIRTPRDKNNRYNILLRSSYMNDLFFQKIEENKNYQ